MEITTRDKEYIAGTYNRFQIEIVKGNGSILVDSNEKEYIDMGSGIGVNAFGVNDKVWKDSIIEQLNKIQHTSNLYYTEPATILGERLCEKTGMKKVFFSNSGAEANECAIKAARKYMCDKKGKEYFNIITLNNSFHGRTITTLAATGQDHYHELYKPLTKGFYHVNSGDINEIVELCKKIKVAAIMVECIQGEGGVNPLDKEYAKELFDFINKEDILLICDEVQCGNGRTGKLYAYMDYDIEPDIVSTAKGLGGGLPIGATLFNEKLENVFGFGDHGSTFGGNPICASGAISIIDRLDDKFLEEVNKKGEYVMNTFKGAKGVESITGKGLMIGIKPTKPTGDIIKRIIERGVLVLSAKDKIRLLPPLNIPMDLLEKACNIIKEECGN